MASTRSIRFRHQRINRNGDDIDITSLLDILTILLVFLIANNSFTGEIITVIDGLQPPQSESRDAIQAAIVVQMNKKELWVEGKKILDLGPTTETQNGNQPDQQSVAWVQKSQQQLFDQGGRRIVGLYNELMQVNQSLALTEKSIGQKSNEDLEKKLTTEPKRRLISLVIDKDIPYQMIKKILYTAAEAGFEEYKLIVLGQN